MKKHFLLATLFFVALFKLNAQNIEVTTIEFNKKTQPAIMGDFDMPGDISTSAIQKKLSDAKIKGGSVKNGFITYQEVLIPEIRGEKMDVYFKVNDKTNSSSVVMLLSKGYENFMSSETDPQVIENAKKYLASMRKDIMSFGYSAEISKQNDKSKSLEKDLKKSIKNGESLIKDQAKLENKQRSKKAEIATLKAEVENQNKTLEFVKAKTGTVDQMNAIKKEISKQEDAVKKSTRNYDNAVKDDANFDKDIEKAKNKISENKTEQVKIKSEIDSVKKNIADLQGKLSAL